MPTDTLVPACRLSGLSLAELWWEYLALGGSRPPAELAARMAPGHEWPLLEDQVSSAAADETLVDGGSPPPVRSSAG